MISTVEFTLDTSGLTTASTSANGTLTIKAASTSFNSIQGFINTARIYNSPPADEILQNLTNGSVSIPLTGLQINKTYYLKIRTYTAANQSGTASIYKYFTFKVPVLTNDILKQVDSSDAQGQVSENPVIQNALNKEVLISKSLLSITTEASNPYTLSCALKDTGIDVAAPITSTAAAYYLFGTTLFFAPKNQSSNQSGGIGFFVNGASDTGYFISIKTSESAATQGDEFKILKVKGGVIQKLPDNQVLTSSKNVGMQVGVIPGTSYRIDVKVKVTTNKTTIIAYVNGFRVVAVDSGTTASPVLPRTSKISLFANLGTIYFDYVYAMPGNEEKYQTIGEDVYKRGFTGMANLAYGELFVSGLTTINENSSNLYLEEFGPVAREIRYVKKRYERLPSYPKFTFQNLNKGVNVLGSKLSSFDAELYLFNSSGVSSSISSNLGTQISVVGNNLVKSDQIVYMDEDTDKFGIQEPISFESYWIQKISDAKNLSDFIKGQWSKNQRVVTLNVFGNPLISVSDIIGIKYDYHGLQGTEKFIVTDVTQSWDGGLETSITARSIYS